jgi:non-ribosomal peptide synthetase component F
MRFINEFFIENVVVLCWAQGMLFTLSMVNRLHQVAGLRPAPVNLNKEVEVDASAAAVDHEDEEHMVVQKDVFTPSKAVGVRINLGKLL